MAEPLSISIGPEPEYPGLDAGDLEALAGPCREDVTWRAGAGIPVVKPS